MSRASAWALRRAVTVAAGVAVVVVALVPAVPAITAAGASGASGTRPSYLAAAEYFGSGNPSNLWSSDLSGAPQAFALMKQEGFNAVGLVLPWGEFQPGLTPPRYDSETFARLDRLIADAARLHMGVILRLSYELDNDPADQLPDGARFDELWSNPSVYAAWLGYVAAVHQNVAKFHNIRAAYISWEDLWEPVFESQGATTSGQQLSLATSTGYRTWLRKHYTLAQVEFDYGTQFANWTAVPTPPATKPSFKLMYQYQDTALVHRLFLPAAKRYPGLTMETRVDVDSLFTGSTVVGSYTHDAQYRLPDTSVTGMYFSPYMDDPSATHVESTSAALTALRSTLSRMSAHSSGRPLVIYEYEFVSNSPAVSDDPSLAADQIPTFLSKSEPLLKRYTSGYALWDFQDYRLSPVYNQSFALGTAGWKVSGQAHAVARTSSSSYLAMGPGGSATQPIPPTAVAGSTATTLSFEATSPQPTTIQVTWGDGPTQSVQVAGGWHAYQVTLPSPSTGDTLTISSQGNLSVTQVELYRFTQLGDVYSATGTAEVGATPLRSLNLELTSGG